MIYVLNLIHNVVKHNSQTCKYKLLGFATNDLLFGKEQL